MEHIKTPFYDQVDRDCPLNEYPRPQFERDNWINLNGRWGFCVTGLHADPPEETAYDREILVPFAPECALSGIAEHFDDNHLLWYSRKFTLPTLKKGERVLLHFGAVDWDCRVYVNANQIGSHLGGYNRFSFDITSHISAGENELTVRVFDPTDKGWQQRGKQATVSHGFWYTATSGIWQTVWLEIVPENRIDSLRLTPDIDLGVIRVEAAVVGKGKLTAKVFDDGSEIAQSVIEDGKAEIPVPDFKCWSPEDPKLYDLELTLTSGRRKLDHVKSYFGMRKFSLERAKDGFMRLFLNNEPYFQTGLLDQGYWPDGGMTAPTDEAMIYDIQTMRELGFNMLRKHIKTEPDRWYYHCDRLGMLVWQDMISGGKALNPIHAGVIPNVQGVFIPVKAFSLKDDKYKTFNRDEAIWRDIFRKELDEMIDQLYNFVSICCWVPFNEGWGQFDALQIGRHVKQKDPTRFVDHASGWYDQGGGDFRSIHRYIMPVQVTRKELDRAFVLSEFGGYSRIVEGHVWNKTRSFGYMMFRTREKLTSAYRRLFEKQIIPNVSKGLAATVYTQVSDVEFEVNGILTYDRTQIKLDADTVKTLNRRLRESSTD